MSQPARLLRSPHEAAPDATPVRISVRPRAAAGPGRRASPRFLAAPLELIRTLPTARRKRSLRAPLSVTTLMLLAGALPLSAQALVLESGSHRLRMGEGPEWSETALHPHARVLAVPFSAAGANEGEQTLSLRQVGVRQQWRVRLNGHEIGRLHQDENPTSGYWRIPAGTLVPGGNELRVEPVDSAADDIELGPIVLWAAPRQEVLSAGALEVTVRDPAGGLLPARITIVNDAGALQETGRESDRTVAARPGVVYTAGGLTPIPVPAGSYTVYAGRGFEYGVDSARVEVGSGDRIALDLTIGREVPTPGWVSADTHVHTLTHSGHGDASEVERAITIAGEGLELPILTDHNVHAELRPVAERIGVQRWYTPVVGNELTTPVGHFNVFPVPPEAPVPTAAVRDWAEVAAAIEALNGVRAVVLNHGRDIHAGFRPFEREGRVAGGRLGLVRWPLPANAMEVINSGSQQTDPLQLFHDWMAMLRRGHHLTPVGSSDSHDVARYIVGQARTYIRTDDSDPARIDVAQAVERFRAGAVMVSFGLLAEITVNGRFGPGDTVPGGDEELRVAVRVLGPSWTRAERVSLYLSGERIRTAEIDDDGAAGVKWSGEWRLPRPRPGAFLVVLAEGPDPARPFWPVAKPYQSSSPETSPRVLGVSGAVRID